MAYTFYQLFLVFNPFADTPNKHSDENPNESDHNVWACRNWDHWTSSIDVSLVCIGVERAAFHGRLQHGDTGRHPHRFIVESICRLFRVPYKGLVSYRTADSRIVLSPSAGNERVRYVDLEFAINKRTVVIDSPSSRCVVVVTVPYQAGFIGFFNSYYCNGPILKLDLMRLLGTFR